MEFTLFVHYKKLDHWLPSFKYRVTLAHYAHERPQLIHCLINGVHFPFV